MTVTVKSRREEYAEVTRAAIVSAAVVRFAADGFAKASIDAIAETARVTKGGVYHHFAGKAELFEAAFIQMEERLVARIEERVAGIGDPWEVITVGVRTFLAECCEEDFRRIALEDAPAALGWARWKEIEDKYFLGMVKATLDALATGGYIDVPPDDLTARMLLGALWEAGLAVAAAGDPGAERDRASALVTRILHGLAVRAG